MSIHDGAPDKANVIALPPLIYVTAFVFGLLIHLALPIRIVPSPLAQWLGTFNAWKCLYIETL